jgi:Uma2 family endonuclease
VVTDRGIDGPPDLVVEVLSPSTESRDRGIKLERYRHYGVPEYWIVDPDEQTVEVWVQDQPAPVVLGVADVFRWRPVPGGAELEMPLGELLGE